jgi:hypothetical protein
MPRFNHLGVQPSVPFEYLPASTREMSYYDLARLRGRDFYEVHAEESHGGNAGTAIIDGKRWMAAAINGVASKESGRFAAFGNFQHLDPELVGNDAFQEVSVHLGTRFYYDEKGPHYEKRILDLIAYETDEFSPHARDAMLGAVLLYNEQQYLHSLID